MGTRRTRALALVFMHRAETLLLTSLSINCSLSGKKSLVTEMPNTGARLSHMLDLKL
jgi:hypothetical protein